MAVPPFTIQPASPHFIKCGEDAIWRSLNWANVADHHLMTQIRGNPANDSTFIRYDQNHIDHNLVMHIDHQILVILHLMTQICSYIKKICKAICPLWSIPWEVSFNLQNKTLCDEAFWKCFVYTYTGPVPIIEHISLKPYHIIINPMSWRRAIEL